MSTIRTLAEQLATDIQSGPQAVQFTGLELVPLLLPFIEKLFQCGKDNDEVTPVSAAQRIRDLHNKNAKRLRKRMSANALRVNKGNITRQQAYAMADATIARALATDDNVIAAACSEAFLNAGETDHLEDVIFE
jgi:hypothetical protein